MIYFRAFSFTDDSANVKVPNPHTKLSGLNYSSVFSISSALQLNRLRRIQSSAYQQIFQAGPGALQDKWEFISASIREMHGWWLELTDQISRPMKNLFRGDILCSSIILMSPASNDYSKFMIFSYTIEYAELTCSAISDPDQAMLYSSLDLLRASSVARRFRALLVADSSLIFSIAVPEDPLKSWVTSSHFSSLLSAASAGGVDGTARRAQRCLNLLEDILEVLGSKAGTFAPLNDFKRDAGHVRLQMSQMG